MAEVALAALAAEAREAIDNEDFDRAARACLRALRRFPRWVEGYWLLGQVLIEREYAAEARACFEAVASAQPDDPRAYEGLAAVAEQRRDLATAIAGLARAVEVGETSQGVQGELNNLLRQSGRSGLELATNARAAHARLLEGQFEAADLAAERALREEPERLDLLLVQTAARLLGDDRAGALSSGERLLDLSPDCLKALAILQHLTSGQRQEGYAAELGALDPEGHTLVWLRGQIAARGGDVGELPGEPRVVTWTEDTAEGTLLAGRPLDRLLPELEQALPQWLRDAAAAPAAEPAPETPAPPVETAAPAPGLPSVLGDVESLVREFEAALQVSPPPTEAPAAAAAPAEAALPAVSPAAPETAPAASDADEERRAAAEVALSAWDAAPPNQQQAPEAPSHGEAAAPAEAFPAAGAAPAEAEQPVSASAAQPDAAGEPWGAPASAATEWSVPAPPPADAWGAAASPATPQPAVDEFGLPVAGEAAAPAAAAEFGAEQHAVASLAPEAAHPEQATFAAPPPEPIAAAPEPPAVSAEPPAAPSWETSGAPEPAFAAWAQTETTVVGEVAEEVPPLVNIADWETPPAPPAAEFAAPVPRVDEPAAEEHAPATATSPWEQAAAGAEQAASEPGAAPEAAAGGDFPTAVPVMADWAATPEAATVEPAGTVSGWGEPALAEAPFPAPAATTAPATAWAPPAPAAAAAPSAVGASSDDLREYAFAAARAGEYLTAVAKLGDALAALRGAGSGHERR